MTHPSSSSWNRSSEWGPNGYVGGLFETATAPFCPSDAPLNDEERLALRWRSTVLRLSDHFTSAAAAHPNLAAVLMESLGNALEQLLLFGHERDLSLLEEWMDAELYVNS